MVVAQSTILAHWRRSPLVTGRADRNDAGLSTALKIVGYRYWRLGIATLHLLLPAHWRLNRASMMAQVAMALAAVVNAPHSA